jgi:hypothetical protein
MSPGPRRNFRNMGFHFLTPIFHILSKPKPNEKLVAYSMKTHTWTLKTTTRKNPKKVWRQITISQLSLSKPSFDKKYWLNFLELPFSNRHWRPETRPDLLPKIEFPLTRYLTPVCTYPDLKPTLEAKVISLPRVDSILAQLCFTIALQHLKSALGYPTGGCRVERECVGYPSVPPSNCQSPANKNCASLRSFLRRRILGRPGIEIQCCQFVKVADSQG